jgi:hypothetical protein
VVLHYVVAFLAFAGEVARVLWLFGFGVFGAVALVAGLREQGVVLGEGVFGFGGRFVFGFGGAAGDGVEAVVRGGFIGVGGCD